jgi:IS30 family transposase
MARGIGKGLRLTPIERLDLLSRVRSGQTHSAATAAVGCSAKTLQRLLAVTGGVKPRNKSRAALRLSTVEREEISRGLQAGNSCRTIARQVSRSASTISRDVAANCGRHRYRAWQAEGRAYRRARRPKIAKLLASPRLRDEVERRLRRKWSPQQISARLRADFPDDLEMRVAHETIYQSLFVQGRGALRRELTRCLRSGRAQRRPMGRRVGTGELRNMVLLSERPAEAEDRAVPGHWEGDLILGKNSLSAVATLVERQTRFIMLCRLPQGRQAEQVEIALTKKIGDLPRLLRRSLTLAHVDRCRDTVLLGSGRNLWTTGPTTMPRWRNG